MTDPAAAISIKSFSLTVGSHPLLREVSCDVFRGELVLLVGKSGSGKTLLIKTLCGLLDGTEAVLALGGSVTVAGITVVENGTFIAPPRGKTGIVFQDFGLIEELWVRGNLDFALHHRRAEPGRPGAESFDAEREALLVEFDLPDHVPVTRLSGGQKQRVALARTLAFDPEILFFDEPTSGLDPKLRVQVARRIETTHRERGKTSVIVTHDYDSLLEIADRVLFLDPATKSVEEVDARTLREHGIASAEADDERHDGPVVPVRGPDPVPGNLPRRGLELVRAFLAGTSRAAEAVVLYGLALIPRWKSLRFGLHYLLYYLRLVALGSSLVYIGLAGGIVGFVATYFVFEFLPHKTYTEPLLLDEVLAVLGYLLFRILVPVMATILIAARCGAAVAADVGNRVYSGQTAAMESLGAPPRRYLLTGVTYAFLLGGPILVSLAFVVARVMCLGVFLYLFPEQSGFTWDRVFHRMIRDEGAFFPFYYKAHWMYLKVAVACAGVGAISYFLGERPKSSGREVSAAVTGSVIWTTLYVLIVHFVFAFLEFSPGD